LEITDNLEDGTSFAVCVFPAVAKGALHVEKWRNYSVEDSG